MLSNEEMLHVMDEYGTYLTQISYMYIKNWATAEEIVQDTFITYFKSPHKFSGKSSLKTYLTKICMNKSIDSLRSIKSRANTLIRYFQQNEEPFESAIDEQLMERTSNNVLMKEVLNLPIKYREIIVYYFFEEMTTAAIADLLMLPEGTVKTRLKRAKERLKTVLHVQLEVDYVE